MRTDTEIVEVVALAFAGIPKPAYFTNYLHCQECWEHNQTLLQHDRESLRFDLVNNPGWDPFSFCLHEGKVYYMPTLVRFALDDLTGNIQPYWQQLLFHLEVDSSNTLITYCSKPQRYALAAFLEHLAESRATAIEEFGMTEEILKIYECWANSV